MAEFYTAVDKRQHFVRLDKYGVSDLWRFNISVYDIYLSDERQQVFEIKAK